MKKKDIINLAREIKQNWQTNDPYVIAKKIGVLVFNGANVRGFKAHTIKLGSYPTTIWINEAYTDVSKKVLCAHELGHAILHPDNINYFGVTPQNVTKSVEYEANLFALALLFGRATGFFIFSATFFSLIFLFYHNPLIFSKNML